MAGQDLLELLNAGEGFCRFRLRVVPVSLLRGQLLLHLYNRLVPLIEPRVESDHYVTLLQQQSLVALYVNLVVFQL